MADQEKPTTDRPDMPGQPQGGDVPQAPPGEDPALYAPSGGDERGMKTVAPAGPGATSEQDVESELQAARDAGALTASLTGVDEEAAAPIPRDDKAALGTPGTAASAPADSDPNPLGPDELSVD